MAFPQVASLTVSNTSTPALNHLLAMDATVDTGDLLIAVISHTNVGGPGSIADWTQFVDQSSPQWQLECFYKIADGSEGGTTPNFVTTSNVNTDTHVYRITAWHGTTPPEDASNSGTSTTPDPPNLIPSWGAADTLWLACLSSDGQPGVTVTGFPASYTDGTSVVSTADSVTSSARRELNAASENPGVFTSSLNTHFSAATVGIRPAVAPAVPTAPANLAATTISGTQIDLAWDDNASDETSFRVERSPNGSTGWATVGTPAADAETFSNTGLTCGTQYFYRVYAVNAVGDSLPSNTDDATTDACPPPPPSTGGNRMGGSGAVRKPPRHTGR